MKKLVGLLLVLAQILLYGNIVFAKTGDVIGYAAHTDIVATINGAQIQSYNYNGYTYVVAEDLANYGFSTVWNASERKITVNRNYQVRSIYSNYKKPYVSKSQVGKKAYNVLESDITAVVNGYHLSTYNTLDCLGAYNINGKTIIPFDILEIFGTVQWDANAREISLWIPGIGNMGGGSKDASTVKNEFLA